MRLMLFALVLFLTSLNASAMVRSTSEWDYPPYCIVKEGKADGFSVELLREALRAINQEVSFYVDAWSVVKKDLEEGKIDVLPLVGRTPEREAVFDFSVPYLVMHGAIVVRSEEKTIGSFGDLKGKTVLVMKDDNAHEFLAREGSGVLIMPVVSFEEALKRLSKGEGDAVVVQKLVGSQLIQTLKLDNLIILPELIQGFRQDFSFAVQEGDKELLARLNEGLSIVMANGVYQKLYEKWLTPFEYEREQNETLIRMMAITICILALIGIFSSIWQYSLQKQVRLKTEALRNSEEALKALNDSLEKRVQKAIEEIRSKENMMLSQSRQAAMGEMLAMIAHQWRQPLSVIAMIVNNITLDIALEGHIDEKSFAKAAKEIRTQIEHLSMTLDDFRNFFKPNKEKQRLFLSAVIDETLKIVSKSLENNGISVHVEVCKESELLLYRNEMIQVLINLIHNAKDALLEHKSDPAMIEINVYEKEGKSVCVSVSDNAGGIPEEVFSKLGEPYVSTKSSNGTGLGIYISKMIVEKHFGGTLHWKNSPQGAEFCVCLPNGEIHE